MAPQRWMVGQANAWGQHTLLIVDPCPTPASLALECDSMIGQTAPSRHRYCTSSSPGD
jgi:hypothetical protein